MSAPRAAIIGGGFMAAVHSRAVRASGAEVVGIASSSADSAVRAAARLGVERAVIDPAELFADPSIDVIHVCTPNATHAPLASAALAAGKHVVCEKPLATSVEDARALADSARSRGLVATVPFVYRFHPMVRAARTRIRTGQLGRVTSVSGSYLQDWLLNRSDDNWRVDSQAGGPSRAFADIGSHLTDVIEFTTGLRIDRLQAITRTVFDTRSGGAPVTTEDLAAIVFEAGDAVGTLLVSQVAPGRKNALTFEVHGTEESVRFEQENPEFLWVGRRRGSQWILRSDEELDESDRRYSFLPPGHPQGYQDAFSAFVADTYAVIAGEAVDGVPTFDAGVRAAVITEAVVRSAHSRGWVDVAQ